MKELWLGIFGSPARDRIALRTQLQKILRRDFNFNSEIKININSHCWYFSFKGNELSLDNLVRSLQKINFYRKIKAFLNFSRPVLFYYALKDGKEVVIECLKDIPKKKTPIPIDQPESHLFPQCFAALENPKIRSIPLSSLEIKSEIPKELYKIFLQDNLCIVEDGIMKYVGNNIDNSKAVIRNLNYHLRDLHEKINRDLKKPEDILQLEPWEESDFNKLSKDLGLDAKLVKRVKLALESDRNCEIIADFPQLGGLISCLHHKDLRKYIEAIWRKDIDDKIVAVILFLIGKKQILRALRVDKMPTGRGDPFSIKRQLRLLAKILLRWKINSDYLPDDLRVYKFLKKEILKTIKKNKSFKIKYLLLLQRREICLNDYEILKKLYQKTKDGDCNSPRDPVLEGKIKSMNFENLDSVAKALVGFKEKVRINKNSYGRGLIGDFLNKARGYIDES
jgi:hypothetical protein